MFIDLVDALRCPRPHDATWLVAAALETRGRCLVRGTLGCPVCEAEFAIAGGVALFDGAGDAPRAADATSPAGDPAELAMRLAALLDLTTPGGIVAVGGAWEPALDPLLDVTDLHALVVEPVGQWVPREPFGAMRGDGLPVAAGALRGVALDARTASADRVAAAVRALRPRGRLVAPAATPVPDGVRELARDERHWVGERGAGVISETIPLRRRR
ncbi:hypothetical protein [Roseisolibacter agri]|uniref:Uncharacterized protein n=1 Tax=Roseisolibacter agri TaxID=2014610 RepID=A0AA37Q3V4_9BACT|nr:hypothetical protein [Roseisolibacter agri]GLC26075.1 hypothetical protein rosag_25880 [Roseisolibacter agri]